MAESFHIQGSIEFLSSQSPRWTCDRFPWNHITSTTLQPLQRASKHKLRHASQLPSTLFPSSIYIAIPQLTMSTTPPCRICTRMQIRKPLWAQSGPSFLCLLCSHPFCSRHCSRLPSLAADICEINHETYYKRKWNKYPGKVFRSLEHRRMVLGEHAAVDEGTRMDDEFWMDLLK